jgi:3-hydroxyisobutyrate dehydrogenase
MRSLRAPDAATVGFIGLGVMGQPMAVNLALAGVPLVVWNRSLQRTEPLRDAGAVVADSVDDVFAQAATVVLMLVDEEVTDQLLGRGTPDFARRVAGHFIISTGSVSPEYSLGLDEDIRAAGGLFVESPVSGSRGPAEAGTLVALIGGRPDDIERAREVLAPMTKEAVWCGPVGNGLLMKLAVNQYLNVMLAALAEAVHFADCHGLDRDLVRRAVMVGPMASELAGVKLTQLVDGDFETRAAVSDAHASTRLIAAAARTVGAASPLLDLASELYGEAVASGGGRRDMITVIDAIAARSGETPTRDTQEN